jgi:hypothetical protein
MGIDVTLVLTMIYDYRPENQACAEKEPFWGWFVQGPVRFWLAGGIGRDDSRKTGHITSMQLSKWPVQRPDDWIKLVNEPQTQDELETLRLCINRDRPSGSRRWLMRTAKRLDLESAVRPRGKPRINVNGS